MTAIGIRRLQPAIGAEILGVDLRRPLSQEEQNTIRSALLKHGVIFFRGQHITQAEHIAFGRQFGTPLLPPVDSNKRSGAPEIHYVISDGKSKEGAADIWHADLTCFPEPSLGSILRAIEIPPLGGDTAFSSAKAAYQGLSDAMKARIDGLTAVHDAMKTLATRHPDQAAAMREQFPPVVHPVVRVHPETGERVLFVNEGFTTKILGLGPDEGRELLRFLFDQIKKPEYQLRFQWQPGSLAFWDNRQVQHYAVADYNEPRHMESIVLCGTRPFGPGKATASESGRQNG